MSYTPPSNDDADLQIDTSQSYTAPSNDDTDFIIITDFSRTSSVSPTTSSVSVNNALPTAESTAQVSALLTAITDAAGTLTTQSTANGSAPLINTIERVAVSNTDTTAVLSALLIAANDKTATLSTTSTSTATRQSVLGTVRNAAQTASDTSALALDATTLTSESVATLNNTATTASAQRGLTVPAPLDADATLVIIVILSPTNASTEEQAAVGQTDTTGSAVIQDVLLVPQTPRTSLTINVQKGGVGIEGTFADSLAASVGASTFIKVAKTVTTANPLQSNGNALTDATAILAAASHNTGTGAVDAATIADALRAAVAFTDLGAALSTSASSAATTTDVVGGDVVAEDTLSSSSGGERIDMTMTPLDDSGESSAFVDAVQQTASTLVASGVVDSAVEAAALVATALGKTQPTSEFTETTATGLTDSFKTIDRTGRPMTFTLADGSRIGVDLTVVDGDSIGEAIGGEITDGQFDTFDIAAISEAMPDVDPTTVSAETIQALFVLLLTSITGTNVASVMSGQEIIVDDAENAVQIK